MPLLERADGAEGEPRYFNTVCLVTPDGAEWLTPRPGAFDDLRDLDGLWLEHVLADVEHEVRYQHGVDNVVRAVEDGSAAIGVLIRPVGVAEIEPPLEAGHVDRLRLHVEPVRGTDPHDRVAAQTLAQPRDVRLQRLAGRARWIVTPD